MQHFFQICGNKHDTGLLFATVFELAPNPNGGFDIQPAGGMLNSSRRSGVRSIARRARCWLPPESASTRVTGSPLMLKLVILSRLTVTAFSRSIKKPD